MAKQKIEPGKRIPPRNSAPEGLPVDYTVKEFCAAVRIAPATAYRLMKAGSVEWYSIGHSRRVKAESVAAMRASGRDNDCGPLPTNNAA